MMNKPQPWHEPTSTPHECVDKLIRQSRAFFDGLVADARARGVQINFDWDSPVWEVKGLFNTRDKNDTVAERWLFTVWEDDTRIAAKRKPLPGWYADFAKATAIALVRDNRIGNTRVANILSAVRRLYTVLEDANIRDVTRLLPSHFQAAHRQRYDHTTGGLLQRLATFIDKKKLTPVRLRFKNPLPSTTVPRDTRPTDYLLECLAICLNDPDASDDEKIILECIRLHLATHDRIGSTVFIPLRTEDGSGPLIKLPREGKPGEFNYGIKYYPEKGFEDGMATKPLDKVSGEMAETAINRLIALCAPARRRARLLEEKAEHGRAPVPKPVDGPMEDWQDYYAPDALIPIKEVAAIFGWNDEGDDPGIKYRLSKEHELQPVRFIPARCEAYNQWTSAEYFYLAADVEAVLLREGPNLVPLRDKNHRPVLTLSNCLMVRFDRQFEFGRPNREIRLIPRLISPLEIGKQLGQNKGVSSIFDRRGLRDQDGTRINLGTHDFRKLKNTFLDEAGLSQVQQALVMGRALVAQNRFYQFSDPDIKVREFLERLDRADEQERLALFRQAVRDGVCEGFVADAYRAKKQHDPVEAEAFLEEYTMHVLVTRYGVCTHNWWQSPCPKHNQCFNQCRHYHVTGDDREIAELEEELRVQERHRQAVREEAEDGAFNADTALEYYDRIIVNVQRALATSRRTAESRRQLAESEKRFGKIGVAMPDAQTQVFPDGQSNYKPIAGSQDDESSEDD